MNDKDNPIVEILGEAMGKLKSIVDIDTVMGDPVEMPDGSIIIPITKVAMGFVAGGGEYNSDNKQQIKSPYPFSGGSGAGFSIKPIGFLVGKNGEYDLITIQDEPAYKKLANVVADLAKTYIKRKTNNDNAKTKEDSLNEEQSTPTL